MAHLLGALGETTLPNSRIVVRVPVEKLFHVDGTPREAFLPCPVAPPSARSNSEDYELRAAFELAARPVQPDATTNDCR
jgi:carboxyl-terminal processing protease